MQFYLTIHACIHIPFWTRNGGAQISTYAYTICNQANAKMHALAKKKIPNLHRKFILNEKNAQFWLVRFFKWKINGAVRALCTAIFQQIRQSAVLEIWSSGLKKWKIDNQNFMFYLYLKFFFKNKIFKN